MNHANTVPNIATHAARCRHSVQPAVGFVAPAAWRVREESEYYIPDLLEDENSDADPALSDAACAHTRNVRDAQRLLDDAVNLVGVLLDAVEQDSDTRAAQARTVLEIAVECLHNAHHAIDELKSRDRNLCLAYFAPKGELEEQEEDGPPMDDFMEVRVDD